MSSLDANAKKVLDAYLHRVADAMGRAERDPDEVEAVREGLREQILELIGRDAGQDGAVAAVERAVASLDAPESYAPGVRPAPLPNPARASGLARLSALSCVLGALVVVALGFWGKPDYEDAGGGAFVIAELVALAAGLISWREPWGRFGAVAAALLLLMLATVLLFSYFA